MTGSPVVELNRAVAVAEAEGLEAGLEAMEELSELDPITTSMRLAPIYCAALAGRPRLARPTGARSSWRAAEPERRFLAARLAALPAVRRQIGWRQ